MIHSEKIEELTELYKKHIGGELSETEKLHLDDLLAGLPHFREIFEEGVNDEVLLNQLSTYYEDAEQVSSEDVRRLFKKSLEQDDVIEMKPVKRTWLRYAAAAATILFVGFGIYFWQNKKQQVTAKTEQKQQPKQQEIMPVDGFAILVLDDGRKVVLDSLNNGVVGSDGGKEILKQEDQLTYQGKAEEIAYNTLLTTKGKVMNLTLADGSRVWLNAESSIHFPTEFTGNERRVEITGEVYFDVATNRSNPFKVTVKTPSGEKAEVEVLGTHFNINAYSNEATIQTTLIEGRIKVAEFTSNRSRIITPGQQAVIDADGNVAVLNSVNTDKIVAWKERNFFYFENNDIKTVMRELTRWFDITVKYESDLPGRTFTGEVNRELSLSAVLKMLEGADVHFAVKGREVIVMQ